MSTTTWNATEEFHKACKKLLDDLPERKEIYQKCTSRTPAQIRLHEEKFLKHARIEHPDIDEKWGCRVAGGFAYFGKVAMYNPKSVFAINPRAELGSRGLLEAYKELKIEPDESEDFMMRREIEKIIAPENSDYGLRFEYVGPNKHPKLSKEEFDGGDSVYWGSSSKNPNPGDYFTRK
jgi:hypothetical protein